MNGLVAVRAIMTFDDYKGVCGDEKVKLQGSRIKYCLNFYLTCSKCLLSNAE